MNSRTTITISTKTKRLLEDLKGDESWDTFLFKLAVEFQRLKRERNRRELSKLLEKEFEEVRVKGWAREY
ncbi:MAG TPA: hypothetical protein ENF87_03030 [Thermoproteales archaeon]|nr:hypothetical protein [Thermoproteales archaeon]